MSLNEQLDLLRQRIDELERRLSESESKRVLECSELHIVDSAGTAVITLSVNSEGVGKILVKSASGKSGVEISGEDENGGGYLEVFKDFDETLPPWIIPRKDSVRLAIETEVLGGGGSLETLRNNSTSVWMGSHYGYGGLVSVNGEHDRPCSLAGRVVIGVDRDLDEGVILIRTVGDVEAEDPDEWMRTLTKFGNGDPPTARYSDADENESEGEGGIS